jgi:glycosyltransferase involved in cell wall biosynthesis
MLNILSLFSGNISPSVIYLYSNHDLLDEYTAANIPVIFLDLKGKYDFWNGQKRLRSLFKEERPDLVVSSLLRTNLLCRFVCQILEIPLLGTLVSDSYNSYQLELNRGWQRQKFRFFWEIDRLTAKIPKLYIANSKYIALSHTTTLNIPIEKTKVVYRGRDVPQRIWERPNNAVYTFLSYGRLLKTKGFEELIKAFAEVHDAFPNSRLLIYGAGNHRNELEKLVGTLELCEVVKLPGAHPKVTDELFTADCFIFPSWYEGFSGTLVEAMLSGIPIIASDIPMNLEAVTDQQDALVFPVRNVDALERKMRFAIENPIQMAELGKNARQEAIERFDINVIAKQYEAVLTEAYLTYCKK